MPPKKTAAPGVTALFVDAGANMSRKSEEGGKTDFEKAINTADWIVSRKLFGLDTENFVCGAFNVDGSFEFEDQSFEGVSVGNEEFEPANFSHLKFITKELRQSATSSNFLQGIRAGIALLKSQASRNPSGITLIAITNGLNDDLRQESFDLLEEQLREASIDLMVIGIEENPENYSDAKIVELVDSLEGQHYSFENVANQLSHYQSRKKNTKTRSFRKMWDIAPGIRFPVTIDLKSDSAAKSLLKFKNSDEAGNEMVRINQMDVEGEPEVKGEVSGDGEQPQKGARFTETADFKYGYNFGKTLIMMDPKELKEKYNDHNFNEKQSGGVLKLIQFTKRANIMDSYLMDASAKTVLPDVSFSASSFNACTSLIRAMLELRVAAICRFTHNAAFHLQLVALLPHQDEETGVLYLRSVKLPFSDDMRSLKFPKLTFDEEEQGKDEEKPTLAQLSAVDDLIDSMQLDANDISTLVEGGMNDPKFQLQCHYLKSFVLNPNDTISDHSSRCADLVESIMAPKRRVEAENPEIFEKLGRQFNLQSVEKTKRERVQVQAEDLQNLIDEWIVKRRKVDEKDGKRQNATKKLSRDEELRRDVQDGKAAEICSKVLQMIRNTCRFQQNGSVGGFYNLLLNELITVRQVLVEQGICEEFNEVLRKVKEEEDFEPFAEFLAENKTCYPIIKKEVDSSEITQDESDQFWDDI